MTSDGGIEASPSLLVKRRPSSCSVQKLNNKEAPVPCYGFLPLVVLHGAKGTAVSICLAQSNLSLQQIIFRTLLETISCH